MSCSALLLLFVFFSTTSDYSLDSDLFLHRFTWLLHTGHRFLAQILTLATTKMADESKKPSTSRDIDEPVASTSRGEFEDEPYAKRRLTKSEILGSYNLARLVRELCTRDQGVAFAEEYGLILKERLCGVHRKPMKITYSYNNTVGSFICCKGACRQKSRISRAEGTWFAQVRVGLPHVYYLTYCFAHRWSHEKVIWEDIIREDKGTCLSSATISDWYSYCREIVVIYQLDKQKFQGKIGGVGKIVQIDESKFGKRKYNKGRRVEGHWVLGLIEDGSEDLRLEVCPDNIRSADVLVPLIKKHVKEGTTIHTDYWRAYDCLTEHGYIHKKVNHSDPHKPFVADDGTHTQRIESQWRVVKRFFHNDNYNHPENFADIIMEFMWRKSVENNKRDPFSELIKVIQYVYDPYKKK